MSGTSQVRWGYAGPWYDEIMPAAADALESKIAFTRQHQLNVLSLALDELRSLEADRLEQLINRLAADAIVVAPYVTPDYLNHDPARREREAEEVGRFLERYPSLFAGSIVKTAALAGHRFERSVGAATRMARLADALRPWAQVCAERGVPLGIENHGDFYCSELVELCRAVPHLHIFLDTGNPFLIGERPDLAIAVAAPWTVGTHFKDHRVRPRPEARPLHFEIDGAALGNGDVPLRSAYAELRRTSPFAGRLIMEIEMIVPAGESPVQYLERSLAFVRSLPG